MKKTFFLLVLLAIAFTTSAQTEVIMEQARERMFNFDYRAAIKLLEEDASKRNAKVEVLEMIGDCHRLLGNKDKAQQFYQKAIATRQCKSDIYRESGLIFLSIGKYPEAKKRFQFYADSLGGTAGDIPLLIATCDTAISWIAKKRQQCIQSVHSPEGQQPLFRLGYGIPKQKSYFYL